MIRVLLADDHTMFREGLKQVLAREEDITVAAEAGNGAETLLLLREHQVDVLILDISMPGMSGLDVLGELRREKPALPILVLSMHPEEQYAVRVMRAGASGYLTKESAASELINALHRVAAGGKYVSQTLAEHLVEVLDSGSVQVPHQLLSEREFQVMLRLASGESLREIADALYLSEKTITTYRARILDKLDLRNNVELTHYAIRNGLVK